nr:antibiotic biosynthesis monooxygenase [Actinomycetota bacterium]
PGLFYLYENWESADDLDAHLQAPHLAEFAGRIDELLEGEAAHQPAPADRLSEPEPLDVRVVGPDERDTCTAQTPGLQWYAAISSAMTGSKRMWMRPLLNAHAVRQVSGNGGCHQGGSSLTSTATTHFTHW